MNFKNKWVIIAIAIVVLAIIIMITRQSGEPTPVSDTTTTTGEVVIDDVLPPVDDGLIDTEGEVLDDEVIIE